MSLQIVILVFIGLAGGFAVSGGVFAFITVLGIIPRVAERLSVAKHYYLLENVIALGGVTGTILTVFPVKLHMGTPMLIIFGFGAGMFIGTLAMALAETLKVIPVLCNRGKITFGISYLILAMALGKMLGSFWQLYLLR